MLKDTTRLSEPLALAFANTLVSERAGRDLLATTDLAAGWLADRGFIDAAAATRTRLDDLVDLRSAVRALFAAVAARRDLDRSAIAAVNDAAALAPSIRKLEVTAAGTKVTAAHLTRDPVDGAIASIAASAIELLGGSAKDRLGACVGPGCRLFFLAQHPARRWCSSGACGNRVRVARHAASRRKAASATGLPGH